jgi:cell division protein FtsQ
LNTKKTIQKILFIGMWVAIGGGMLTLLLAAIGRQNKDVCKGYDITIKGERTKDFFIDNGDIAGMLKYAAKKNLKGEPKSSINLGEIETSLEKNPWIKDAQLYFDNKGLLHVSVIEREPVARIFTSGGRSFYLDANNYAMPLSEKGIAQVPVFTGFPDKREWSKTDSVLVQDINTTAVFINGNPFWKSQVAQINIVPDCGAGCWQFEMTPVVGNHIVKLGNGKGIDKKMNRLFVFYKQVLAKTGFDKYKIIDVRFNGQVVGTKRHSAVNSRQSAVNSQQLAMDNWRYANENY